MVINAPMFDWNAHRFSGGALALDLANTIVWPNGATKSIDRFEDPSLIISFSKAATAFRREELEDRILMPPTSNPQVKSLLHLRNVIDVWLRPATTGQQADESLHRLFAACAKASEPSLANADYISLGEACARSALRFMDQRLMSCLKSCPSCRWLYVDKSKNQSRQWCDMKVCGNRAKARAFYSKKKLVLAEN